MTTIAHEPGSVAERRRPDVDFAVREMWTSLAIATIWLAVLFDAIFGPNIVTADGASSASIPSAVVIAPCAFFATWLVAKHGFRRAS